MIVVNLTINYDFRYGFIKRDSNIDTLIRMQLSQIQIKKPLSTLSTTSFVMFLLIPTVFHVLIIATCTVMKLLFFSSCSVRADNVRRSDNWFHSHNERLIGNCVQQGGHDRQFSSSSGDAAMVPLIYSFSVYSILMFGNSTYYKS